VSYVSPLGLPRDEWLPQEGLAFEGRSWDKVAVEKEETANPSIAVSNGDELLEFNNKHDPSYWTETSTEVLHDNVMSCDNVSCNDAVSSVSRVTICSFSPSLPLDLCLE